jgi:glycosyltransferase involved in cell wall biosynthesis
MMVGLPVVGLATTELPTVIENGVSGYVATDPARLVEPMQALLGDRELAARIGAAGREQARARFGIERFVRDWDAAFREVAGRPAAVSAGSLPVADRSVEAVA